MDAWTPERVIALAPDAASASAGQGLATPKKWSVIGRSERAIWGLCQGSGKDPYQARVDLGEPAFKCSCPSRKFPCKHGLGLLLLYSRDAASFKAQAEPAWVADWLATRREREEKKVERARVDAEKPVDADALAKRAARRQARVREGVDGCKVWLEDLVRRGLAAAQSAKPSEWLAAAARMGDAQAPGLASYVRRVPEVIASGSGWEVRTLDLLGRIHLLLAAADRMDRLPPDLACDVRTALGYTQAKEDALAGEVVRDRWASVGQVVEEDDRLTVRRTWLVGAGTGRRALLLDFAAGAQPLDPTAGVGVEFEGEVAFYPSCQPLRAIVKTRGEARGFAGGLGAAADGTIEAALGRYAAALARNPWTARWPMVLANVRPGRAGEGWYAVDSAGQGLPIRTDGAAGQSRWRFASSSGGSAISLAVEWDGERALLMGAFDAEAPGFHDLSPRWAA